MQTQLIALPDLPSLQHWLAQQLGRATTEREQQLLGMYPQAPVQVLNWVKAGDFPDDLVTQLAQAWIDKKRWPDLQRADWQVWLDTSEQLLQDLLRMKQGLSLTYIRHPQLQAQASAWLQREGLTSAQLSEWLKLCYATRKMATEQSGLNGALLVQSLWARWR